MVTALFTSTMPRKPAAHIRISAQLKIQISHIHHLVIRLHPVIIHSLNRISWLFLLPPVYLKHSLTQTLLRAESYVKNTLRSRQLVQFLFFHLMR